MNSFLNVEENLLLKRPCKRSASAVDPVKSRLLDEDGWQTTKERINLPILMKE